MEGRECKGCVYRIRKCVLDLLEMEEDLQVDGAGAGGEDEDMMWEFMASELPLKSTFLYCDLNQVISGATDEHKKKVLTDLSNNLFSYMEELGQAVKSRDMSLTQVCYSDTAHALQEVMAALLPAH